MRDNNSVISTSKKGEKHSEPLNDSFVNYLYSITKLSESSVKKYLRDLKIVRKLFLQYLGIDIKCEVIEIIDYKYLKEITDLLYANQDFMEFNQKKHHHFSAPLNKYLEYLAYNNNSFEFDD